MSDGLAGHEREFFKHIAHLSWLDQKEEYSILNEAFPNWFDLFLAYALDINA